MPRSDACRGWVAITRWLLFAGVTACVYVVGPTSVSRGGGQDSASLTRKVVVTSDPPGAMIWTKEANTLTCTGTVTPGTIELKFHGENDLKKIRLRKFGYDGKNVDIKSTDDKINAALGQPAADSFEIEDNAPPDLKQLNAGLEKEFQKSIFANPESFRCVPFELQFILVWDDKGVPTLGAAIILDRSFGGSAFSLASHGGTADERRRKVAQAALEGGIAELVAQLHRITVRFPAIKVITVACMYSASEARLGTESANVAHSTYVGAYGPVVTPGGVSNQWHLQHTVVFSPEEVTVVEDRDVQKVVRFVIPAAQIPDTLDKKAITDAVLAVGTIDLGKESDSSASKPSTPTVPATPSVSLSLWYAQKDQVEQLLAQGADVNAKGVGGNTPLHIAALNGRRDVAELLLAKGAEVDARNDAGETPLHDAAIGGQRDMVGLLLAKGADVNALTNNGLTPADAAELQASIMERLHLKGGRRRCEDVAKLLREQARTVNVASRPKATVTPAAASPPALSDEIGEAAKTGDLAKVASLLQNNPGLVFSKDNDGQTLLHFAAASGHRDVAELLLTKGAEVNSKDSKGATPLHYAGMAVGDKTDIAELLLANRADVNATDSTGITPLHLALYGKNKAVAQLLLANKADVNAMDKDGATPLNVAMIKGLWDVAELLLTKGADVNAKDDSGDTFLHISASEGRKDVVDWLLAKGADVNAKNNDGAMPLHYAAEKGHRDMAESLLAKGAAINAKTNKGDTPLHVAASEGHRDVAELLLARGAEVNAKDYDGKTPLHYAVAGGFKDVAELLRRDGGHE